MIRNLSKLKKGWVRILTFVLSLGFMLCSLPVVASAATSYVHFKGNHHLSGGVGKNKNDMKYYWISGDLNGWLYNCAKDAMLDWNNHASYINFSKTSTKSKSSVDIYCSHDGKKAGYNAYTLFRNGWFSYVNPDKNNWKYGQIYYNLDNGISVKKSRNKVIAVFAHEIGHCFGLDENNSNRKSIMCQAGSGRSVTKVQKGDFKGVKSLY